MSSKDRIVLNMGDARKALELAVAADVPVKFMGPPGVGKTAIATQYAMERAIKQRYALCELNAATANLADVMGYLMPKDETYTMLNGEKFTIKAGEYTYPYWFRDKLTGAPAFMFEHLLLVIEEYGQATGDVKRALATVINEKRIGAHKLPPGARIVLLSNRDQDRSGVSKDFDFVINRLVEIEVNSELQSWLEWAMTPGADGGQDVSSLVTAFAANDPGTVFGSEAPKKQGPWCTPRSLVLAGRVLDAAAQSKMAHDDPILVTTLAGQIGVGPATNLSAFLKLRSEMPTYEQIVNDPEGTPVPNGGDAQYIITFALASKVDRKHIQPVVTFMQRLKKPFGITFIKAAFKRDQNLVHEKCIREWALVNKDLIAAVNS